MMRNKKFLSATLTLAMSMLLSACGTGGSGSGGSDATLIVANGADPVTFDIHKTNDQATTRIAKQMYETLIYQNEDLEFLPGLALSWKEVGNNTYEFVLREGVKFHNGEEFDAFDVEFTMKRAATMPNVAAIVGALDPAKVEVVSKYVVRIGTKTPFGPFIVHLAHPAAAIMNKEAVEQAGADYGIKVAVGTGPFKFVEWISGEKVTLERFEEYWGAKAKVAKLELRTIREAGVRLIGLENGEIDIAYDIAPADLDSVRNNPSLTLLNTSNFGAEYLALNTASNEYLKDKNVRKAIAHIIDVDSIVKAIYKNVGTQMTGPINDKVFGFNSSLQPYAYNETLARQFLSQSAWPNGGFTLRLFVGDNSQERIAVAQVVQAQLLKLNINATLNQLEWGAFLAETAKPIDVTQTDLFLLGWTTVTADADYGLFPLFHSSASSASNRTFFRNAQVDAYLDIGRSSLDQNVRKAAYEAAQAIIRDELPWVFLQTRENVSAISNKVSGFRHHPMGAYNLANVSKND